MSHHESLFYTFLYHVDIYIINYNYIYIVYICLLLFDDVLCALRIFKVFKVFSNYMHKYYIPLIPTSPTFCL